MELEQESKTPGELEYRRTLRSYGYLVEDVSKNPDYWYKDIDCISTNPVTGNVATHEIKWDRMMSHTGNLYIETHNPRSRAGQGWFNFCEADLLAYGDANNKIFYVMRVPDLKRYVREHESSLRVVRTFDGSEGYALPLDDIKEIVMHEISCA